jgi:putative transposase
VTARSFNPLLLLLARLTDPQLARSVRFLKAENAILRSRLPKRVDLTQTERNRLFKLGESLGSAIKELISIVSYRTFLRWKARKKGTIKSRAPNRHPHRTPDEIRALVVRIATETGWGYTRIVAELRKLGIHRISRTTVRNNLKEEGLDPGPDRGIGSWDEFIRIHWKTLFACDFFTKDVWTLFGKVTYHVFFVIELHTRRVHIAGITLHPNGQWMAQTARNIRMWLEDKGKKMSYLLKDGDAKITAQFDAILETTGAKVKKVSRRAPEMNSFAESWVASIKRECLDHFMVLGEQHLEHIVNTYVQYYNTRRPHRGIGNVPIMAGVQPPPPEDTEVEDDIACDMWLGGLLKHYRRAA